MRRIGLMMSLPLLLRKELLSSEGDIVGLTLPVAIALPQPKSQYANGL